MSEIDDIFARLGGGKISASEGRDRRDIPRRGKAGGSRVVEVVHVTTGRSSAGAAVARRSETGVRAQTWDGGFPTKSAPQRPSPSPQTLAAKASAQVGHVVTRWESVADAKPIPPAAPLPAEAQAGPEDDLAGLSHRGSTRHKARPVADPFNPEDDRANCIRCGYAVEATRERRGLMTCAACAG